MKQILTSIKNNIPNTITSLNLVCGAIAIMFSFRYAETFDTFLGVLKGYEISFVFIGLAAVFDFCDGFSARLLHAYSDLGKELDSLSDLVSFGVAPAMLVYNTVQHYNPGSIFAYFAALLGVFGALRLAKFNIDTRQKTTFIGLPIPANAIFWIGMVAWFNRYTYPHDVVVLIMVLIFSYLMVSPLKMFSLKFQNLDVQDNFLRYVLILGAILFVVSYGICGFAWTIVLYVFLSMACHKYIF